MTDQFNTRALKISTDTSSELYRNIEDSLKSLIEENINNQLRKQFYFEEVETSIMLDLSDPCVSFYVTKFPEKYFRVIGHKQYVLRPAACAGALKRWQNLAPHLLSAHLPAIVHESALCHRLEQSGEVKGLERAFAFRMPDYHMLLKKEQTIEAFKTVEGILRNFYKKLGLADEDFKTIVRFNTNSLEERSQYEESLNLKENVLKDYTFETKPEKEKPYYNLKIEYAYKDLQIGTIQIDSFYPLAFELGQQYNVIHFSPGSYTRLIDLLNKANLVLPQGIKLVVLTDQPEEELEKVKSVVDFNILVDNRPLKQALSVSSALDKLLYPVVLIKGKKEAQNEYSFVDRTTNEKGLVSLDQLKNKFKKLPNGRKIHYYEFSYYKYCDIPL